MTHKPKEKLPIREWLETQGRFKHLFANGDGNEEAVEDIQEEVDRRWRGILELCGETER